MITRPKFCRTVFRCAVVCVALVCTVFSFIFGIVNLSPAYAQTEKILLQKGHADFGPTLSEGSWRLKIRDDTGSTPVWRNPADVVMEVSEKAVIAMPQDSRYSFIGAQAGQKLYVIPQTQNPDVMWLGWNTQENQVVSELRDGAHLSLDKVEGPGKVHVYLENGNLQAPQQLWSSDAAMPQKTWIEANTHTHANWVFSKKGIYHLTFTASGTLKNGQTVSHTATLNFAVGAGVNAQDALEQENAVLQPNSSNPHDEAQQDWQDSQNSEGSASLENNEDNSQRLLTVIVCCAAIIAVVALILMIMVMRFSSSAKKKALDDFSRENTVVGEKN
ncbi:TIGR03773 family transporter-associated surface protein [Alloscardovia omnicolens]|uniref:TIGR03773 family transporter-associated surface protein n=1 Tax=Alloscardovia omnicolens TaxID=419015 RepID=UPI003A617C13